MQMAGLKGSHLSFQQVRQWSLQGESQGYRAQCTILLEGELDRDRLQMAVQEVVSRHEILRTVFRFVPGMEVPVQVVVAHTEIPWPTINL